MSRDIVQSCYSHAPPDPRRNTVEENTPPDAPEEEAREIHPVTFFGKDEWAGMDLRPVPVAADTPEEDESAPKDSSAAEPVDSSESSTIGLEDVSQEDLTKTTAPAEKDNGQTKEPSPGQPTSSSEIPTSPGKNEQPADQAAESTQKPSSPTSPTLPKPTKQSSPASAAK